MAASHTRRSRGEGSIYKTKDGGHRASLILVDPLTGQPTRRYIRGRTRAEVGRKLDAMRTDAASGLHPTGETVGAYLDRWIVAVGPRLRPSTAREYRRHVRTYWTPLASIVLTRLVPGDVERAMAAMLARGLSPMTVAHARSTLRRALHDAQRDGLVTRNVASLARPPRIERKEMKALSVADVHRLLDATEDHDLGPLFALAVSTGLRAGELLGLRWDDLDGGSLTVRRAMARDASGGWSLAEPKTRRSRRTVMLPAIGADALRRQQARQEAAREAMGTTWQDEQGLVFTNAIGQPLNTSSVSHAFRIVADRLELPVRLHDLRHTAASLMLASGVPLLTVSRTLGHSTISITADVYSHLGAESQREASDGVDRALR